MNTQPDRQDGDGLRPCPFCAKPPFRSSRKVNPSARCLTDGCYGQRMSVVNLDDPVCVAAWNTRADSPQPTRDAAEGADPCPYCKKEMHGADDCEHCGCGSPARPTRFATPQPAPDAVRALADRIEKHSLGWIKQIEGEVSGCSELDACLLEEEEAAIVVALRRAALVPSPDGVGKPTRDMILSVWKIVGYDKSEKFCWVMRPDQLITALSPSATGAAEPGTYRCDKRNCFYPECDCRKLATSPVRGDREAIARIAKTYIDSALSWHPVFDDGRGGNDLNQQQTSDLICKRLADAILPVQPGAGERK